MKTRIYLIRIAGILFILGFVTINVDLFSKGMLISVSLFAAATVLSLLYLVPVKKKHPVEQQTGVIQVIPADYWSSTGNIAAK